MEGEATTISTDEPAGLDPVSPLRETGSATDRVVHAIMQGIRNGSLVPGQHLLEPELSQKFGLSRGSLREAMKHLAAEGIVTLSRFRGAYISTLNLKSVLDLLDTLEPLARLAARLAAEHCVGDENRNFMRAALENLRLAGQAQNRGDYLAMRRKFYDAMLILGGNEELARVMPLARTDLFRAQLESIQTADHRVRHVSGYVRMVDAILARDATEADAATAEHFAETRRTISQLPLAAFG